MHHIQLLFDKGAAIGIEGEWHLKDQRGTLIDEDVDHPASRKSYQIHRLLMQSVTAASIDSPTSLSITFANGDVLTILDSSQQYESFSLHINGREFYV